MSAVVAEESTRGPEEVPRLEEPEHHREQRERARVVVGARDEPEHLDLRFDRGAVVREDVDPVVLRQRRRRALRAPGKREPARAVEAPDALTQRALGAVL